MAIMLVTPGNPTNAGSALPGGLSAPADDLGFDFGNLLSLHITGLPMPVAPAFEAPSAGDQTKEEVGESITTIDTWSLLAGTLAVSPESTSSPAIPEKIGQAGGLLADGRNPGLPTQPSTPMLKTEGAANPLPSSPPNSLPMPAGIAQSAAILAAPVRPQGESASVDFSTVLSTQSVHQTGVAQRPEGQAAVTVSTSIHNQSWAQSFGEQIVWLARNDQQSAQLNINPPQLGPIQINLKISGDQATATFASPHAEVRQVIEDAMPRLRELLSGAGIELGQTSVGAQMAQQEQGGYAHTADSPRFSGDPAILRGDAGRTEMPIPAMRSGRGLVDLFA